MARKHRAQTKLRGTYGKPIAKMAGQSLALTQAQVTTAAKIIIKAIRKEIRRDIAIASGIRGPNDAVVLPNTKRFAKSFTYKIKGKSTIEITSNWPTASAHTNKLRPGFVENQRADSSAPMEMWWLTQPSMPNAKIVQANGQVMIRTTPLSKNQHGPWIHPGFKKYTFLERGLRKGRIEAARVIAAEVLAEVLQQHSILE